jgi:dimethylamine/trimethylamine dehydrogenase
LRPKRAGDIDLFEGGKQIMARDPRYDVLFQPIRLGPVVARNRFCQVPQCNGMGQIHPRSMARMRGIKAEGGWGVIFTEVAEVHPTTDLSPKAEMRLWTDQDLRTIERMTGAIHEHGSLAGIELAHLGLRATNLYSREAALTPSGHAVGPVPLLQARMVDQEDLRAVRRWYRTAAVRASNAGIDLVNVYAGHDASLLAQFLSPLHNHRADDYGGSLRNRVRLLREVTQDVKDAVGDRCGVGIRLILDEVMQGGYELAHAEGLEIVELLAELPDFWDISISFLNSDIFSSRFQGPRKNETYAADIKLRTKRPVITVGLYTSPDEMANLISTNAADLVGAARPSIADPFLPNKIEEGRPEDIRECIGCNICLASDRLGVPIRCTQNPTSGEEWKRDWHPERIPPKTTDDSFLIVGGGPAGLESGLSLARRGYAVTIAEAAGNLGGRLLWECQLPGLGRWMRVRDYRVHQLGQLPNVAIYRASRLSARDILEFGATRVVLATGSKWRRDLLGRTNSRPVEGANLPHVIPPEHLIEGVELGGRIVVFDDDGYYLGSAIAEKLARDGHNVTMITPSSTISAFSLNTMEHFYTNRTLLELGIRSICHQNIKEITQGGVVTQCVFTRRLEEIPCDFVIPVTARIPNDSLYRELAGAPETLQLNGIQAIDRIGDCFAPGVIATAVYSGHLFARELSVTPTDEPRYKRELAGIEYRDS